MYDHFVQHTTITFEEQPVAPEEMRQRIVEIALDLPDEERPSAGLLFTRLYGQQ